LINHAFDDCGRTWELDWLQNRMRYVESAENMSYAIPGFRESRNYFPNTIYYTATAFQVREYKKATQRLKEEKLPTVDVTANAKLQAVVSKTFGGDGQDWQQSQQQELEEVDANTEENGAMMEMLKQFQGEQKRMREEQIEARSEQQEIYKALLKAHEDQKLAADELRKELALLKEKLPQ
ncbi:hypothetical protein BGX24_000984, partial [Mortierella sp. AD032]